MIFLYIGIGLIGLIAIIGIISGAVRRASRMGWTGLEIAAITGLCQLLKGRTFAEDPLIDGIIALGILLVFIIAVCGLGMIIRTAITKSFIKKEEQGKARYGADRFFGAIMGLLDFVAFALFFGGIALAVVNMLMDLPEMVTQFVPFLLDFSIVAFLTFMAKWGYNVGLVRAIWMLVICATIVAALGFAVYLTINVEFLSGWAIAIRENIALQSDAFIGTLAGYGIISLAVFLVFLIVIILLNVLINKPLQALDGVVGIHFIDGALLALVFLALNLAVLIGLNFGVSFLATFEIPSLGIEAVDGILSSVKGIQEAIGTYAGDFANSSYLATLLYQNNPLRLLIVGA